MKVYTMSSYIFLFDKQFGATWTNQQTDVANIDCHDWMNYITWFFCEYTKYTKYCNSKHMWLLTDDSSWHLKNVDD